TLTLGITPRSTMLERKKGAANATPFKVTQFMDLESRKRIGCFDRRIKLRSIFALLTRTIT
ncbi:hypothetical protein PMI41_03518, partial [Phyllobacterium sp. YR531]